MMIELDNDEARLLYAGVLEKDQERRPVVQAGGQIRAAIPRLGGGEQ